ncbi:hypothetical protein AB0G48_19025 [Streptomyces rubiginosohelvolus]|uniref:hypothetical protein n=1 Tax=Streptomyces rubiginosohelvolus TaxID=67362 RepID=UPI0033C08E60
MNDWLTTCNTTSVRQAVVALGAAKAEVMLSGPDSVHPHVIKVNVEDAKFYVYLSQRTIAIPVPTQLWRQKFSEVTAAQTAFVTEAAKVLDNPDLEPADPGQPLGLPWGAGRSGRPRPRRGARAGPESGNFALEGGVSQEQRCTRTGHRGRGVTGND